MAMILFVEDDKGQREAATKFLENHGHTVYPAEDGTTAKDVFDAKHMQIDIVITDLGLPDITGAELTRRIRATNSPLPIIIYSGDYNGVDATTLARAAGATMGIAKNARTPEKLLEAIELLCPP
jgi:CheY-like chemotaxis protein